MCIVLFRSLDGSYRGNNFIQCRNVFLATQIKKNVQPTEDMIETHRKRQLFQQTLKRTSIITSARGQQPSWRRLSEVRASNKLCSEDEETRKKTSI